VSEKRAPISASPRVVLGSDGPPSRFEAIDAIAQGGGGSDSDCGRFVAAWRLLKLAG
jgi:hypothetical protein